MTFPIPSVWSRDNDEFIRDEKKRQHSPCSFFFSQGRSIYLAADYFTDDRMTEKAKGGVAKKHKHRIQLALFGQLMASFEYMLKDFMSQSIDAVDVFDYKLAQLDWVKVNVERILFQKVAQTTAGALLIHPTLGWHNPVEVNKRYKCLFNCAVIEQSEIPTLNRLWILRHSVAHNAGFVTAHDASRVGSGSVSEKVIDSDEQFILKTFEFLCPIAERLAERCGKSILKQWLNSSVELESDFNRDNLTYKKLKWLGTYVDSKPKNLPEFGEKDYLEDFQRLRT